MVHKKQIKKKRKNLTIGLRSPMGKMPNPKSIVKGITKAYS